VHCLVGRQVEQVTIADAAAHIDVHRTARIAHCPGCRRRSHQVHSGYRREIADLPIVGRATASLTGAKIFFVDEAHFSADVDLRGKWVLKGEPALVGSVEAMELDGNRCAETWPTAPTRFSAGADAPCSRTTTNSPPALTLSCTTLTMQIPPWPWCR
jgi:hypothetical protein